MFYSYQVKVTTHEPISAIQNLKTKMAEGKNLADNSNRSTFIMMDRQAHKSRGALQLVDAFLGFVIFFAVLRSITLLIG